MQLVHISFLRQFRQEVVELPVVNRQYRNTFLRHFSGNKKEKALLEQVMEQKLAHSGVVGCLIDKIETDDLNTSKLLYAYANKMLRLFSAFAREEPYTSRYYRKVSQTLGGLIKSVEISREGTRTRMQLLKAIVAGKNERPFHAANFRDIQLILNQYLANFSTYYQDFVLLLEQESNNSGKAELASPVELSLFKLLTLLEDTIIATESTIAKVEEWRKRLRILIIQETYN